MAEAVADIFLVYVFNNWLKRGQASLVVHDNNVRKSPKILTPSYGRYIWVTYKLS